jgi:hypothetical protein
MAGALALRVLTPRLYRSLVEEDGVAEWATCIVYVAAAVVAVAVVWALREGDDRIFCIAYVALAAGLVLVAGEEISWGQRQLGFAGPDALVDRNEQSEANLHNTLSDGWLHGVYIAVGLYAGLLSRWLAPRLVGARRAWLIAPPVALAWWFLVPAGFYAYVELADPVLRAVFGDGIGWRELRLGKLQEVAELVLAIGFLLFLVSVRRRAVSADPVQSTP